MTLRHEITPLIEEYQKANGRGSHVAANNVLLKIIDVLVNHLEKVQPNWTITNFNPAPPAPPVYQHVEAGYWPLTAAPNYGHPPGFQPFPVGNFFPTTEQSHIEELKRAVEKLHEANYLLDPDYTAIKNNLGMPLTEAEKTAFEAPKAVAEEAVAEDTPEAVVEEATEAPEKRPGRKPRAIAETAPEPPEPAQKRRGRKPNE